MKNRNITCTTIALVLGFVALCPMAQAVIPPPGGGYPGGNTAEGQSALLSRTTGIYNTGLGIYSLLSLTRGQLLHGCRGWDTPSQHCRPKYGHWRTGAF